MKVLILWGVVLVSFVLFWICHTYITNYQNFIEPQNYLLRAEYYLQNGNKDKALHELEFGMNTFRPVSSEALLCLMKIKKGILDKNEYNELEKKHQIIVTLENCTSSENLQLDTKLLNTSGISLPTLSKPTQSMVLSMWKLLTRSTLKCMQNGNLSWKQILNFLYYSGGIFYLNSNIGDTGFVIDDDVFVISEGSEEGSGAQIWFQGRNFGGHRRGFYVLILTPPPCKVYRSDRFDVWDNYNESIRMTRFLEEVPEGYIGIFAVADEASENMTEELERMLFSFGFAPKTYVRREMKFFGYGYAFSGIGVKGAVSGTAIQNWAEYDPSKKKIPWTVCGVMRGEKKQ
ncbi:MAG: interleukin-like EMT inducer domain-containing protein [Candidatus Hydrogenedens sp.]